MADASVAPISLLGASPARLATSFLSSPTTSRLANTLARVPSVPLPAGETSSTCDCGVSMSTRSLAMATE